MEYVGRDASTGIDGALVEVATNRDTAYAKTKNPAFSEFRHAPFGSEQWHRKRKQNLRRGTEEHGLIWFGD